jgi:uncharacterized membrane protein YqjE
MAFREPLYWNTEGMTPVGARRESLGELIGDLASNTANLVRDEVALVRQELQQKVKTVQAALVVIAAGAFIALIAAMALCAAVIMVLSKFVGVWQSTLIVGLALAMAAGAFISIGISRFKRTNLKPEQTLETLEENKEWLKEIT